MNVSRSSPTYNFTPVSGLAMNVSWTGSPEARVAPDQKLARRVERSMHDDDDDDATCLIPSPKHLAGRRRRGRAHERIVPRPPRYRTDRRTDGASAISRDVLRHDPRCGSTCARPGACQTDRTS